jgi:hypothetical protein
MNCASGAVDLMTEITMSYLSGMITKALVTPYKLQINQYELVGRVL